MVSEQVTKEQLADKPKCRFNGGDPELDKWCRWRHDPLGCIVVFREKVPMQGVEPVGS